MPFHLFPPVSLINNSLALQESCKKIRVLQTFLDKSDNH
ncbi:hypothetical protein [Escherichia coli IS1]|nr:hypothetical protein AC80_3527 [Escherichia coli 1-110-08_S4_C1]KDW74491.1 hypothetical protein AB14_1790 [Escherichia coli 1-392-07_S1_C1]KDW82341.1 hypothetical protein AB42_2906 [Escherichia coli 1-392-07_S1_C2]KEJ10548.1 hypothetical protein AB50_3207 [Escherichia coli 6-175-07_S1_C2]KEM51531.1 hypothetical protein AB79_3372 [Escherichia coli 6-175-07_S1_C3]PRW37632.1 hypothetical protein CSC05_3619 [Escherichia coli]CDK47112.1 hypothetical protein [Escherichia coli IS1]